MARPRIGLAAVVGLVVAAVMTIPLFFLLPYWAGPFLCDDGRIFLEHSVDDYGGDSPWEHDGDAYDPICVRGDTRTPLGSPSVLLVLLVALFFGGAAFVVLYALDWKGLLPRW